MTRRDERVAAVTERMDRIHQIADRQGINRAAVDAFKDELVALAERRDLFSLDDFPLPEPGAEDNCNMYLLAENDERCFSLYLQACRPGLDVPPHNHATWAVIAGMEGVEQNRFYRRQEDGPVETGRVDVALGSGVALLPDDLHSIHIHGDAPVLNFHMYGRALDTIDDREYWSDKQASWLFFPAQEGIIDRRDG